MAVSPDEAERLLATLERATLVREKAREDQLAAIREAADAGVPITHIARAADLSREHIYRLLRD